MGRPPAIPYDEIPKMKFGKLKPIRRIEGTGRTKWLCECDCGKQTIVIQKHLCSGNTQSCGCSRVEHNGMRTHGLSNTRLYVLFCGIKERCYSPNSVSYPNYGGKGIKICQEWLNDFKAFYDWAVSTGYDETLPRGAQTIDRIDYNGDYCPENCRWITIQEQQRNKCDNVYYEMNGESHLLCEWAEILEFDYDLLRSRVGSYGWTLEQALNEPLYSKVKNDCIRIEHNGEKLTIKEWSEKLGIPETRIRGRLHKKKDPEYVLRTETNIKENSIIIEYKGQKKNLAEWGREFGISYGT